MTPHQTRSATNTLTQKIAALHVKDFSTFDLRTKVVSRLDDGFALDIRSITNS